MANQYPRVVDEEFLMNFAKAYTKLKENGLIPAAIKEKLMGELKVKESTYYRYLQLAREKHYITDTYEENLKRSRERHKKLRNVPVRETLEFADDTLEVAQIVEEQEPVTPVINEAEKATENIIVAVEQKQSRLKNLFGKIFKR